MGLQDAAQAMSLPNNSGHVTLHAPQSSLSTAEAYQLLNAWNQTITALNVVSGSGISNTHTFPPNRNMIHCENGPSTCSDGPQLE